MGVMGILGGLLKVDSLWTHRRGQGNFLENTDIGELNLEDVEGSGARGTRGSTPGPPRPGA